jgi:hypothetical protein
MTHDEHRERHKLLHAELDELLADWIRHNPGKMPSQTSLLEFLKWSHEQAIEPTEAADAQRVTLA